MCGLLVLLALSVERSGPPEWRACRWMSYVRAASLGHVLLAVALDRGGRGKKEHLLMVATDGDGGGGLAGGGGARSGWRRWSTSRLRRHSNGAAEGDGAGLRPTALVRGVRRRIRRRSTWASGKGRRG